MTTPWPTATIMAACLHPWHAWDDDGLAGQDFALLEKVQSGDKVRFRALKVNSDYVVTSIEPTK